MVEAHRQADAGHAGAVAAMMALVMGMRASEIVSRVVRDLDDGGALLWIPDSKTLAGRRKLEVPELLQAYRVKLARERDSQAALFGEHWRDWPRKWVQRICKVAGVPKVDGAWDAGASRDPRGGQWDHLPRGGVRPRSRVLPDDGRELREARGG